jgi:phosphoribosylformylglycinamidine (FGAM) synthase-like amidotransferase family enzyme
MKAGIVIFPGINRERDMAIALKRSSGHEPRMIWHKETDLGDLDLVVIPGGFSFGDYLRCGAMAARSPVMRAVATTPLAAAMCWASATDFRF